MIRIEHWQLGKREASYDTMGKKHMKYVLVIRYNISVLLPPF